MTNVFDANLPKIVPNTTPEERPRSKKREVVPTSAGEIRRGKIKLAELADEAFDTLRDALSLADWPTAVVAAKLVLDRSGHGPSSTIKIDDSADLSDLTTEELRAYALRIGKALHSTESEDNQTESNGSPSTGDTVH